MTRAARLRAGPDVWGPALVVVLYAVGAVVLLAPLPLASNTHLPGRACGDVVQQTWFVAEAHQAVLAGHLSFLTNRIYFPTGVNLLDNTSLPLLTFLSTPITSLLGPVAVFDLLIRLAFVVSALACYYALHRVLRSRLAACVGGALYGFSPYMTHDGRSHVFLSFVPLPPLIFLLVYRHLKESTSGPDDRVGRRTLRHATIRHATIRRGVVIAVMAVLQFFLSSEILLTTSLLLAATLVVLAAGQLRRPRALVAPLHSLGRLAVVTFVVATPLLAYPAWYALAGPEHTTRSVAGTGTDWSRTLWPVDNYLLAGHLPRMHVSGRTGLGGDTSLIGIPLLVVAVVVVILYRRSTFVRCAAVLTVVAWVFALGPRLLHKGRPDGIALPFALFEHLPGFKEVVTGRITMFVALGIAALTAVAIDRWLPPLAAGLRSAGAGRRLGGLLLILIGIAYLTPSALSVSAPVAPSTASTKRALELVPTGAVVLAYPLPRPPEDEAMLWQTEAGMRFSLVDGYSYQPSRLQRHLAQSAVQKVLVDAATGRRAPAALISRAGRELPTIVRRLHVTTLLADLSPTPSLRCYVPEPEARYAVGLFTRDYGPPRHVGAFDVWPSTTHVSGRHR
jgi:hypothetical protein